MGKYKPHKENCKWIPEFHNCIFEVSTPRKWAFCLYFSSIHDYWPPKTRYSSVHNA